jgi:hypothetical protein
MVVNGQGGRTGKAPLVCGIALFGDVVWQGIVATGRETLETSGITRH